MNDVRKIFFLCALIMFVAVCRPAFAGSGEQQWAAGGGVIGDYELQVKRLGREFVLWKLFI